jgi:hypothetical protein
MKCAGAGISLIDRLRDNNDLVFTSQSQTGSKDHRK